MFGSLGAAALGVPCLGEMTGLVLQELAEFFPLAGGIGAEPVQLGGGTGAQLVEFAGGVLPDAGGFGGGGFGAGLGDGGPLCGLLGFLASFLCFVQRGIACSFSGLEGGVAFGLGGSDGLLGLAAYEVDLGGVGGGDLREPVVGLACPLRPLSGKKWSTQTSYAVTSLAASQATPGPARDATRTLATLRLIPP